MMFRSTGEYRVVEAAAALDEPRKTRLRGRATANSR